MTMSDQLGEAQGAADGAREPWAWERPEPVWVHSKSRPPYRFHPWRNLCAPDEWPFDLEVLRGTEDYGDILDWFARKYPVHGRRQWDEVDAALEDFFPQREISVHAYEDPEESPRKLIFHIWGSSRDAVSACAEMDAFFAKVRKTPELVSIRPWFSIDCRPGAFEHRHLAA
ncbi:hypothetical protein [Roseateles sp.]|uniref:hypothetical protein n=1 Tax=Roseateles sp. TaxID=1971397 RepID=UPI002F3E5863